VDERWNLENKGVLLLRSLIPAKQAVNRDSLMFTVTIQ